MTERDSRVDPSTPAEWQEVVNLARMYLLVDSAQQCGLVTGGPVVDVARCEDLLARGRTQGYVPRSDDELATLFARMNAEGTLP